MNFPEGGSTPLLSANVPGPVNSAGRFGCKTNDTEPVPGTEKLALTGARTLKSRIVLLLAIVIPIGSFAMLCVNMLTLVTW